MMEENIMSVDTRAAEATEELELAKKKAIRRIKITAQQLRYAIQEMQASLSRLQTHYDEGMISPILINTQSMAEVTMLIAKLEGQLTAAGDLGVDDIELNVAVQEGKEF